MHGAGCSIKLVAWLCRIYLCVSTSCSVFICHIWGWLSCTLRHLSEKTDTKRTHKKIPQFTVLLVLVYFYGICFSLGFNGKGLLWKNIFIFRYYVLSLIFPEEPKAIESARAVRSKLPCLRPSILTVVQKVYKNILTFSLFERHGWENEIQIRLWVCCHWTDAWDLFLPTDTLLLSSLSVSPCLCDGTSHVPYNG